MGATATTWTTQHSLLYTLCTAPASNPGHGQRRHGLTQLLLGLPAQHHSSLPFELEPLPPHLTWLQACPSAPGLPDQGWGGWHPLATLLNLRGELGQGKLGQPLPSPGDE